VELLGPLDNNRIAVRCSVSDAEGNSLLGPVVLEVDPSKVERLDPDPTVYLTRRVLRVAAADIAGLDIASDTASASFVRTSEGWGKASDESSDAAEMPSESQGNGPESLARMLTESDAILMLLSAQAGNGFSQRMTVLPVDRLGTPIVETLRVGIYTADGSGVARLGVESQGVLRIFDTTQAAEPWAWMQSALEPE
jgi:hypothetical protein